MGVCGLLRGVINPKSFKVTLLWGGSFEVFWNYVSIKLTKDPTEGNAIFFEFIKDKGCFDSITQKKLLKMNFFYKYFKIGF